MNIKKQMGMGALGWLLVIAIGGFTLTCFFKMGPAYLDNMQMQGVLSNFAAKNKNFGDMSKSEIREKIAKQVTVNGVRDTNVSQIDIVVLSDKVLINNVYEVRVALMANVDVVMTFKNQLNSDRPEECCKFLIEDGPSSN